MTNLAILDDDRDIRNSLAKYLDQNGFTVFTAEDGKELPLFGSSIPPGNSVSLIRRVRNCGAQLRG